MTIIVLIVALQIKEKIISNRLAFILNILCCVSILFSYSSSIVIFCTFLAKCLYDKRVNKINIFKSLLIFLIPISLFSLIIFFLLVIPCTNDITLHSFWFSDNIVLTLKTNNISINFFEKCINYCLINQNSEILNFPLFLFFIIIFLYTFYKEDKFKYYFFICVIIFPVILSLMQLYPFGPERIILYLIPIFYLLIFKSFDIDCFKKYYLFCIPIILFLYVSFRGIYPNYKSLLFQRINYEWGYTKYS